MSSPAHKTGAKLTQSKDKQEIHFSVESALPPAELLKAYSEILPSAAERYFTLFEKQAYSRMADETKAIDRFYRNSFIGMIFGFIVNISALVTAYLLAVNKLDGAAITAIIMATLTNLTFYSSFIARKSQNK